MSFLSVVTSYQHLKITALIYNKDLTKKFNKMLGEDIIKEN
jgi:hypothetical protein